MFIVFLSFFLPATIVTNEQNLFGQLHCLLILVAERLVSFLNHYLICQLFPGKLMIITLETDINWDQNKKKTKHNVCKSRTDAEKNNKATVQNI